MAPPLNDASLIRLNTPQCLRQLPQWVCWHWKAPQGCYEGAIRGAYDWQTGQQHRPQHLDDVRQGGRCLRQTQVLQRRRFYFQQG